MGFMLALGSVSDIHGGALDMGSRVKPTVHAFRKYSCTGV